jgi:hypothetical protein
MSIADDRGILRKNALPFQRTTDEKERCFRSGEKLSRFVEEWEV